MGARDRSVGRARHAEGGVMRLCIPPPADAPIAEKLRWLKSERARIERLAPTPERAEALAAADTVERFILSSFLTHRGQLS